MEEKIWDRICGRLQTLLPSHIYHSLVEPTTYRRLEDGTVRLDFRDQFSKENFEHKCLPALRDVMRGMGLEQQIVTLFVDDAAERKDPQYEFHLQNLNP